MGSWMAGEGRQWGEGREDILRGNPRSSARKNKGDFKKDTENTNANMNVKKNVQSRGR